MPILGYISKIDRKINSGHKGLINDSWDIHNALICKGKHKELKKTHEKLTISSSEPVVELPS